jgi:hypothetical protein
MGQVLQISGIQARLADCGECCTQLPTRAIMQWPPSGGSGESSIQICREMLYLILARY